MPMTQTQLADAVADKAGLSRADAKKALAALEEVVLSEIGNAEKIKIGGVVQLDVRVRPASGQPLTTQIYIAGDSTDGDFVLAGTPAAARERLTMALAPAAGRESGALSGSFDFVMR